MADQVIKHDQIFEDKVIQPTIDQFNEFNKILGMTEEGLKKVAAVIGKKISIADPKTISDLETFTKDLEKLKNVQGAVTEAEQLHVQVQELQKKKTKEIRDEIKGQVSAYQALQNEFAKVAQKAKDLAAAQGINSKAAMAAAFEANKLNQKLKDIDATMGIHNRNVGGYAEGIGKAFEGTGILGEGIEKLSAIFEKAKVIQELFATGIEKLKEVFTASKTATEAETVAEEVNTAAKEANVVATEAEVVVTKEAKAVEEVTTVVTEANTVATEANTVAEKSNALAKLGWIGAAIAAAVAAGALALAWRKSTQEGKDQMDVLGEMEEITMRQAGTVAKYRTEIYNLLIEEKKLHDEKSKNAIEMQEYETKAAVARAAAQDEFMINEKTGEKEINTTVNKISLLKEYLSELQKVTDIKKENATKELNNAKELLNIFKGTSYEREYTDKVNSLSVALKAVNADFANQTKRTRKQLATIEQKDFEDRKKMLQDSQKEEIEIINTAADTKTKTIQKQLKKDIALNKLENEQQVSDLIDKQNKLGAIDASGIDHTADFQREVEDLKKVGLKKQKDIEEKAQTDIWKISTDAQTEAYKAQEAAEKEHVKYELEALKGKYGMAEQIISEQELNTKIDLGTATPAEEEAWAALQISRFKNDNNAFIKYELDALRGKYGAAEKIIATQELKTKIALGTATPEEIAAWEELTRKTKKDEAIKTVEQVTEGIKQGLQKRSELQQQADQRDIDMHTRMLEVQAKLAAEGKANVLGETMAQTAKAEEKKIQDAKKAAKVQQTITMVETFEKTLQAALKADKPFMQAFGEALASEGLVSAAFSKLFAGFYEGTEDTGTVANPLDDKGGRLTITHDNERIVPKRLNDMLGGISNDDLVNRAIAMPSIVEAPVTAAEFNKIQIEQFTNQIVNAIKAQPVQNTNLGRLGEWTEKIMEQNRSVIIHHKKNNSRPSLRLNG